MLYVICYMLYVICYMLYVICYMLYVICYMLYMLYVICYMDNELTCYTACILPVQVPDVIAIGSIIFKAQIRVHAHSNFPGFAVMQ
jgi:hypothetical protein